MTEEDFVKLKSLRDDLKALLNDPKVVNLKNEIISLEKKCDHKYPDGKSAWKVGWGGSCHDAECLICKFYDIG